MLCWAGTVAHQGSHGQGGHWTTEDANPRHVYHDALIALDEIAAWCEQFKMLGKNERDGAELSLCRMGEI